MFKFRLQRVLELRQKSEEEAATRLAEARGGEAAARQTFATLQDAREEGLRKAAPSSGRPSVGDLQNLRFLVDRIDEHMDVAHQEAEAAAQQVLARMDEFSIAFRDRRMLDRLHDKALESYRVEEVQEDRKLMDSIALTRFLRSRGGAAS